MKLRRAQLVAGAIFMDQGELEEAAKVRTTRWMLVLAVVGKRWRPFEGLRAGAGRCCTPGRRWRWWRCRPAPRWARAMHAHTARPWLAQTGAAG